LNTNIDNYSTWEEAERTITSVSMMERARGKKDSHNIPWKKQDETLREIQGIPIKFHIAQDIHE
jgi:hypothetical protein